MSTLGLILMAASVVTAAIMPSKSEKKSIELISGSLTFSTILNDGDLLANRSNSISCELDTDDFIITNGACNVTISPYTETSIGLVQISTSISTNGNVESVYNNAGQNNTSDI